MKKRELLRRIDLLSKWALDAYRDAERYSRSAEYYRGQMTAWQCAAGIFAEDLGIAESITLHKLVQKEAA